MNFANDPMFELSRAKNAIIKQQISLLEMMTGCETANRYHVYIQTHTGEFIYLFKCKENSDWCVRNCVSSEARPFNMQIKHIVNNNDYGQDDFANSFANFERPFKCTCCCLAR